VECRKIIHVDMDAFFASVEQRDNPRLRGKAVIVGGDPARRGVVSACSYEARKFGVHSAMPSKTAVKLCPHAVFLKPRFEAYEEASRQVSEIFRKYTDLVEPMSLDEAYLDVTENRSGIATATATARDIKSKILAATGLTASAGVSYNMFIAKVASDYRKPDGLTVVTPVHAQEFIDRLAIGRFFGVGKVTERKFLEMGVRNGRDLRMMERSVLVRNFGKMGVFYYQIARGIDERFVNPCWIRKSVSCEETLDHDTDDMDEILALLDRLSLRLESDLFSLGKKGRTITLKVKYDDFQGITRSITLERPTDERLILLMHVKRLLEKTEVPERKVRLLGMGMSNFDREEPGEGFDCQLFLPFN
jgi:DNA polymerase IV